MSTPPPLGTLLRSWPALALLLGMLGTRTVAAAPLAGSSEIGATLASRSFRYTDVEPETELWTLSVPLAAGVRTRLELRTISTLPTLLADWSLGGTLELVPFVDLETPAGPTSLEALRVRLFLGRSFRIERRLRLLVHGGYHGHSTRAAIASLLPSLRAEALEGGAELRAAFAVVHVALGVGYRVGFGTGELGGPGWFESARFVGVRTFAELGLNVLPRWDVLLGLQLDQAGYDFNPLSPTLDRLRRAGGATDREVMTSLALRFSWDSGHDAEDR